MECNGVQHWLLWWFGARLQRIHLAVASKYRKAKTPGNRVSYIIALVFIPLVVFQQSMTVPVLTERLGNSGIDANTAMISSILTGLLICLVIIFYVAKFEKTKFSFTKGAVLIIYISFFSVYVTISSIVSGIFAGNVTFNHILYVINIGVVLILLTRIQSPFSVELNSEVKQAHWMVFAMVLISVIVLAFVLVNLHGELGGSQTRFGLN